MSKLSKTSRTKVKRAAERGSYDRDAAHAILHEGLVAHVGICTDEGPVVIPMAYALQGDDILLHGSVASRLLNTAATGVQVCATVTLLDGIVVSRSWFNHSMNYRSLVVFGEATVITDPAEEAAAFECLVDHLIPGSREAARAPNRKEAGATTVLRLPLNEASVKIRSGAPEDNPADVDGAAWCGVIPILTGYGAPETAPDVDTGVEAPGFATGYARPSD
ncbi:MAG: pyridoxamine 5'-phosphate oxidase family protein [Pseudomonadota bacterium]